MSENLDGMDGGEKFLLVNGIVLFGRGKLPGFVAYGLRSLTLILEQNGSETHARSVGVKLKSSIGTSEWNSQKRCRDES